MVTYLNDAGFWFLDPPTTTSSIQQQVSSINHRATSDIQT